MTQPRLFVEHLTVMDVALLDEARGLLGQSWIVDLELEGPLNEAGMVLDFGEVKRLIKRRIDEVADHVLLVPKRSPSLTLELGAETMLRFESRVGGIEHRGPAESLCVIDAEAIDTASVTPYVSARLRELLDELGLPALVPHIALHEETIDGANYQYCHGLKKHDGNCQRIAHGHRSRLHVWLDGQRAVEEEARIAEAWSGIYLGTREDLAEETESGLRFAHISGQGRFELTLPRTRVELIDTDSTVEWIARHLADRVKKRHPAKAVRVAAYEGVQKGAVAYA